MSTPLLVANGDSPWLNVAAIALSIVFAAGVIWLGLLAKRWIDGFPQRDLHRRIKDFDLRDNREPGDVHVRFHTYHGLLLWAKQAEHSGYTTPNEAIAMLDRLHRFNLRWGWFADCGPWIPLISWLNYRQQRASIRTQQEAESTATSQSDQSP